jgi:hypothetical protein
MQSKWSVNLDKILDLRGQKGSMDHKRFSSLEFDMIFTLYSDSLLQNAKHQQQRFNSSSQITTTTKMQVNIGRTLDNNR